MQIVYIAVYEAANGESTPHMLRSYTNAMSGVRKVI